MVEPPAVTNPSTNRARRTLLNCVDVTTCRYRCTSKRPAPLENAAVELQKSFWVPCPPLYRTPPRARRIRLEFFFGVLLCTCTNMPREIQP